MLVLSVALLLGLWLPGSAAFVPGTGAAPTRSGRSAFSARPLRSPSVMLTSPALTALLPLASANDVSAFKASGAADVLGSIEIGVLVLGVAVR